MPCALSINDAYFGLTDLFERYAEINLNDRVFIRFSPEGAQSLSFFLTDAIRFAPPRGCEVYLLHDGIAIYAKDFPPTDYTLTLLYQQRFDNALVTVFKQGETQVSLETEHGVFLRKLPPAFCECTAERHGNVYLLRAPKQLAVLNANGELLLLEHVLSHKVADGELTAVLPLSDSLSRTAECTYELSETACKRTRMTISQPRAADGSGNAEKIRDELLPYVFFESVLLGANYAELLSDELLPKAEQIASFLGDFKAVCLTEEPNVCALVKRKAPSLFSVERYEIKTQDGKITDVIAK